MSRHDRVIVMRKTAREVGVTQLLLDIANSEEAIGLANTGRLVRALALLGEPGYEGPESARRWRVRAGDGDAR